MTKPHSKVAIVGPKGFPSPLGPRGRRHHTLALLRLLGILAFGVPGLAGCQDAAIPERPNLLLVVWDTVRAERMGLYGYERDTTPFLSEWATSARVFDDCASVANTTIPSHASMFTGLMPSEHGATNSNHTFSAELTALPEILQAEGFRTFFYGANPHLTRRARFDQGFDVVEHPWSPSLEEEALPLLRDTVGRIAGEEALERLKNRIGHRWMFKSIGALARKRLERWLDRSEQHRPFFAFLNYMEAHYPVIPTEESLRRLGAGAPAGVSPRTNLSWIDLWSYTLGVRELSSVQLARMGNLYDAALVELDQHFAELIRSLESRGVLEDTIVVLTSDHGEHLGEHHLLDHQYSVFEPLRRVPLVLYFPPAVPPGRELRPVMNFDLFPTLLDLLQVEHPAGRGQARHLLDPQEDRIRITECREVPTAPIEEIAQRVPTFDPAPWRATLMAFQHGRWKLIEASDGRTQLFDLREDPVELKDLVTRRRDLAESMRKLLHEQKERFQEPPRIGPSPRATAEERRLLESVGYVERQGPQPEK